MSEADCPTPELLRALAEPEGLGALAAETLATTIREHAHGCPRCQERLARFAREDRVLRELATPVTPDPRALEATLAAVREAATPAGSRAPTRRHRAASRPRVPWGVLGAAAGIALVALVIHAARPTADETPPAPSPVPSASPLATRTPPPSPSPLPTPSPAPSPSPSASEAPAPSPAPESSPLPTPTASPAPEPSPDTGPIVVAPSPSPTSGDATAARVLARAASSGLAAHGRELALGEALPEGTSIEVRAAGARVESEGAGALVLSASARLTLERAGDGGASFVLARGRALATGSGGRPWSVGTGELLCSVAPGDAAASFVLAVDGPSVTVTALDGGVRVEARRPGPTDIATDVAGGFAVSAAHGKLREVPEPADVARALEWVPRKARPTRLPAPRRVVRELDPGSKLVTDGLVRPADAGSARPYVLGVAGAYDQTFVRWSDKAPSLATVDPSWLLEVTVEVSRPAKLSIMLFDDTANENFEWAPELPAGRWVTVVAPLSRFANKTKAPRPIAKGDVVHALFVGAGPSAGGLELRVRGARLLGDR